MCVYVMLHHISNIQSDETMILKRHYLVAKHPGNDMEGVRTVQIQRDGEPKRVK